MPDRTDNSENPSTLPRPELNPLLNPLLAENMGRWASVYYTSPPEKRQEAVLQLLRELEREQGHAEPTPAPAAEEPHRADAVDTLPPVSPALMHCQQCGHENSADQKFCGMCGVPLLVSPGAEPVPPPAAAFQSQFPESPALESSVLESQMNRWPLHVPEASWNAPPEPIYVEPIQVEPADLEALHAEPAHPELAQVEEIASEPPQPHEDLPPLSLYGQDRSQEYERPLSFLQSQPEEPRSYSRLYLGAALALIIFVLGYVAWRNTHNNSATAPVAEQHAEPAPDQPAPPTPSKNQSDVPNSSTIPASNMASDAPQAAKAPARTEPAPARPNQAALIAKDTTRKSPPPQASAVGGSRELAIAEGYLNGTNGQQRNSAEAAQWLWKAVEKRNTTATMLLSDLYLKGNGVPKNCDQAHVLLDAAASRGVRDAAEHLRNLKAYGCE